MKWLLSKIFTKKSEGPPLGYSYLNVWAAIDGPFENEDLIWVVVVRAEFEGRMLTTEVFFLDFTEAYDFKRDLDSRTTPLEIVVPKHLDLEGIPQWARLQ